MLHSDSLLFLGEGAGHTWALVALGRARAARTHVRCTGVAEWRGETQHPFNARQKMLTRQTQFNPAVARTF